MIMTIGMQISLTGLIFSLLFLVPIVLRYLGVNDDVVPTWLKVIILIPASIGFIAVSVGILIDIWV